MDGGYYEAVEVQDHGIKYTEKTGFLQLLGSCAYFTAD